MKKKVFRERNREKVLETEKTKNKKKSEKK
jgi:hypothetical protein